MMFYILMHDAMTSDLDIWPVILTNELLIIKIDFMVYDDQQLTPIPRLAKVKVNHRAKIKFKGQVIKEGGHYQINILTGGHTYTTKCIIPQVHIASWSITMTTPYFQEFLLWKQSIYYDCFDDRIYDFRKEKRT